MSDKEEKQEKKSHLAQWIALLTAIAAILGAIGFNQFFPDIVKSYIFVSVPQPSPSVEPSVSPSNQLPTRPSLNPSESTPTSPTPTTPTSPTPTTPTSPTPTTPTSPTPTTPTSPTPTTPTSPTLPKPPIVPKPPVVADPIDAGCKYNLPPNFADARVNIQPEKKVFTEREQINARVSIHGISDSYKPWITVILSSKPETAYDPGDWKYVSVDKEETISLPAKRIGAYEIRLFLTEGGKNVQLGYCPITVQ
jgi:hypothetical protein